MIMRDGERSGGEFLQGSGLPGRSGAPNPVSVRIMGMPSSRLENGSGKFDWTFWVLTAALAAAWSGLWLFPGKRQVEELTEKRAALRAEVSELRSRLRMARRGLAALQNNDPLAWERVARTRLGWMAPGEVLAYPDSGTGLGSGGPDGGACRPDGRAGGPGAGIGDSEAGTGGLGAGTGGSSAGAGGSDAATGKPGGGSRSPGSGTVRRDGGGSDPGPADIGNGSGDARAGRGEQGRGAGGAGTGAGAQQEPPGRRETPQGTESPRRRESPPAGRRDTPPPERRSPDRDAAPSGPVRLAEPSMPPSL
ncbi:MAG: septum formation initiator family protein [Planctomycetota bacterium]|nr:septum formation initiator family protein [Planctomycetota bacterium]